jgi:cysteine-rich repeat protein
MKPTILIVTALTFAACEDFWGFNSTPADAEEGDDVRETADTFGDMPAEAVDGEAWRCTSNRECSDGQFCNGEEICSISGECEAGALPYEGTACNTLDGGIGRCIGGDCVPVECGNGFLDSGEECDDGNDEAGDGCEADCTTSCRNDTDCLPDPVNTCVDAKCVEVSSGWMCEIEPLSGGECDDGNACTLSDTCDRGACVGQGSLFCNDNIACTADSCDPGSGCVFEPMDDLCDDGNPCTRDSCTSTAGTDYGCVHDNLIGTLCNDGFFCTLTDICSNGECTGQGSPCNDGLDCTEDICDEAIDSCGALLRTGFCLIEGRCFYDDELNYRNECQFCSAGTNPLGWSNLMNGVSCYVCVDPCPCDATTCECCNGVCGDYSGPAACPAPP